MFKAAISGSQKEIYAMRLIETKLLQEGMVLASPVYSKSGKVMLRENVVLKPSYVERIKKMDIQSIYIFDELSKDINTKDVIDRKHLMDAYRGMRKKNYDLCIAAASSLVRDLLSHVDDYPDMKQLRIYDNYTFNHSIHVAVLCTIVGMELGIEEEMLDKLALAGMMHDIGKEKIPAYILRKKSSLTAMEYSIIKKHPEMGYRMVKDMNSVPAVVKHAILCHHENEDGTGYPGNRKGNELHLSAKLVHLCDVYDAMVSKRCYKDEICPSDVLEYIRSNAGKMFDKYLVDTFQKTIFPYTTGISVELSDGRQAIVQKNYRGYPDRPDVMVTTGQTIILRNIKKLTIRKILS